MEDGGDELLGGAGAIEVIEMRIMLDLFGYYGLSGLFQHDDGCVCVCCCCCCWIRCWIRCLLYYPELK